MKTLCILTTALLLLHLGGCSWAKKEAVVPAIVPPSQKTDNSQKTNLKIIGAVEPIYILPMKSAFTARVDTGATTSSLDASDIKEFERDGEKWVSFQVTNRKNGESYLFEKPLVRTARIIRANVDEHRYIVKLDVQFAGKKFPAEFSLVDRKDFNYQGLIGRNILSGRAIVDTTRSFTLK